MNKQFDHKLKKAIQQLPEFKPDSDAWNKINSELAFRKNLQHRVADLPSFIPKENSWEELLKKFKAGSNVHDKKTAPFYRAVSIAASIIVLTGLYFLIRLPENQNITQHEEVIYPEEHVKEPLTNESDEAIVYINQQCQQQNIICSTTEFKELWQQLIEIEHELEQLKAYQQKYATSPAMVKSIIRMENLKSEIILELMKNLHS